MLLYRISINDVKYALKNVEFFIKKVVKRILAYNKVNQIINAKA